MKTTDFYKKAITRALNARESIEAAKSAYRHECELTKNAFDTGILGENGYKEQIEKLAQERDAKIEDALSCIDGVAVEYSAEMAELGRLDGDKIDDGAMKLLNSGLALTEKEWQRLADDFQDNFTMTRILQQHYDESRSKDSGNIQGIFQSGQGVQGEDVPHVTFGQSPESRKEIFNSFTDLIRHSCVSGTVLREFADRESYWNYLAKDSLGRMQPFADEDFDSVETDFPVTYQQVKSDLW